MVFKVKLSEQAACDLDDIIGYINDRLYSPQSAEQFYNKVSEKIGILCDNPYLYPLHKDEKLNTAGYRFVAIGNYLMFYIVNDASAIVDIVRIIYGRRDMSAIF